MIKKFLVFICLMCFVSFSFSQGKMNETLKKNTIDVVNYFEKALKLNPKQKTIFMNAFSEYAHNMNRARSKIINSDEAKDNKAYEKKAMTKYMLRFTEKRDNLVKECLKKKQLSNYDNLLKSVHPHTLQLKKNNKKSK